MNGVIDGMNGVRASSGRGRSRVKLIGMGFGIAASAVLVVLSVTTGRQGPVSITIPQAGSGSAPVNTTFTQPVISDMNLGATAAASTPGSVLATPKAVPAVKAGG